MRTFLKPLSFLPAILLMYVIFTFSGQTGDVSSQLSLKVSVKVVQAADYVFDAGLEEWQIQEYAQKINFITRKLAHMTEYFALAIAVSFPLYVYGMHGVLLMVVAGLICVAFAAGDEFHQSFVAGRGPSVRDVGIDSVGVFLGIILVRIIGWTGRNTIFRPRRPRMKKANRRDGRDEFAGYDDQYYDDYYDERYNDRYNDRYDDRHNNDYYDDARGYYYDDPEREPQPQSLPRRRPGTVAQEYRAEGRQEPRHGTDVYGAERRQGPQHGADGYGAGRRETPPRQQPQKKEKKEKDWFFDL